VDAKCLVTRFGYVGDMEKKIWTAAELEKMTPSERREISRAAEVGDLDQASPELLQRAREFVQKRIASEEGATAS